MDAAHPSPASVPPTLPPLGVNVVSKSSSSLPSTSSLVGRKSFKPSSRAQPNTDNETHHTQNDASTSDISPEQVLTTIAAPIAGDSAVAHPNPSQSSTSPPQQQTQLNSQTDAAAESSTSHSTNAPTAPNLATTPAAAPTSVDVSGAPSGVDDKAPLDGISSDERVPPADRPSLEPSSTSFGGVSRNSFSLGQYYQARLSNGSFPRGGVGVGVSSPSTGTPTQPTNTPNTVNGGVITQTNGTNATGLGIVPTGAGPHRPIPRARVGSPSSTNTNSPLPLGQFHMPNRPGVPSVLTQPPSSLQLHSQLGLRGGGGGVGGVVSSSGPDSPDLFLTHTPQDPTMPSPMPSVHFNTPSMVALNHHGISPMPSHMYSYAGHPHVTQPLTPLGYMQSSPFGSQFNSPIPSSLATPNPPIGVDSTSPATSGSSATPAKVDAPTTGTSESAAIASTTNANAEANVTPPNQANSLNADATPPSADGTNSNPNSVVPLVSSAPPLGGDSSSNPPQLQVTPTSGPPPLLSPMTMNQMMGQPNGGMPSAGAGPLISPLGNNLYSNMFQQMSYPNTPLTQTPLPMFHAQDSTVTPMPYYLQASSQSGGLQSSPLQQPVSGGILAPPPVPGQSNLPRPPSSGTVVSPVPIMPAQNTEQWGQVSQLQQLQAQISQMNESLAQQYGGTNGPRQGSPPQQQHQPPPSQAPPLDAASYPLAMHPSPTSLVQNSTVRGGSSYYGGMPPPPPPQQPSPLPYPGLSPQPNNLTNSGAPPSTGGAGVPTAGSEGEYHALQRLQYQLTMQLKQQQEQLHQQAMQIQYQQQQHSLYMQQLQRQQQQQQQQSMYAPTPHSTFPSGPPTGPIYPPPPPQQPQQQPPQYYNPPPPPSTTMPPLNRPRSFESSVSNLLGSRPSGLTSISAGGVDDPRMRTITQAPNTEYKYPPTTHTDQPAPINRTAMLSNAASSMDSYHPTSNQSGPASSAYNSNRSHGLLSSGNISPPDAPTRSVRQQVISSQASLVAAATNTARTYQNTKESSSQRDTPREREREKSTSAAAPARAARHTAGQTSARRTPAAAPPASTSVAMTRLPEPIIINTGPKKTATKFYPCSHAGCSELLKTRFSLTRHMKKHTGEKPHSCPYESCGKSFPEASTLKRHLRIHTGEKPFKCSFHGCQKAFADATNVKRHEMTHTGEKPYRCLYVNCPRSFSRGSSLRQHMISLHKLQPNDPTLLASVKRGRLMKMKKKRLKANEVLEEEAAKNGGVAAIMAQHGIQFPINPTITMPASNTTKSRARKPTPTKKAPNATSQGSARGAGRKRKRRDDDDDDDDDEEDDIDVDDEDEEIDGDGSSSEEEGDEDEED